MFQVQEVNDVDMAFPAKVSHLMPPMNEIPGEFNRSNGKWNRFQADWFFFGVKNLEFTPKPGIDPEKAFRHLSCIQGSFEPSHEHKAAAVAYLASLWFEDVKYERAKEPESLLVRTPNP